MNRKGGPEAEEPDGLEDRLTPGAGRVLFEKLVCDRPSINERRNVVQLLSRISSAMRLRAAAQSRSAVRSETSRLSAVSDTVKPAK